MNNISLESSCTSYGVIYPCDEATTAAFDYLESAAHHNDFKLMLKDIPAVAHKLEINTAILINAVNELVRVGIYQCSLHDYPRTNLYNPMFYYPNK